MNVLFTSVLVLLLTTDPGKIGKVNAIKSEAKRAFNAGDYKTAIEKYRYLTDSLQITEDEVRLNLASAYFHQNDTANAVSNYQNLLASNNNSIRSIANQQIGILNNRQGKLEEALSNFKQSIKADPANKDARYNYEMLKKKIEEKKKQEEQQKKDQQKDNEQKKDQQNDKKDQQDKKENQDKKDQQQNKDDKNKDDKKDDKSKNQQQKDDKKKEGEEKKEQEQKDSEKPSNEKKEMPPSVSEKLQQMKISEDKAKMLLEAMKNQEVQYLQQNKRKATKAKDKGKPDW